MTSLMSDGAFLAAICGAAAGAIACRVTLYFREMRAARVRIADLEAREALFAADVLAAKSIGKAEGMIAAAMKIRSGEQTPDGILERFGISGEAIDREGRPVQ